MSTGSTNRPLGAPREVAREGAGGSPSSFDPGRLIRDVDEGASRLEQAADALDTATRQFEELEEQVDLELAKLRLEADSTHLSEHGKLPSQERRNDIALTALKRDHPVLYSDFFAAKATVEALSVRYRSLAAAVSARQSLLRALEGGR